MQLSTLLLFVGVLACPIVMGVMIWMMNKNMGGEKNHSMEGDAPQVDQLQALIEQRQRLEQEIAEIEKITGLQAQKDALARVNGESADGQPLPVEASHNRL